jgi:DNA-directed RNA polymerase subunit RPC12/RpoP
MAKIATSCGDCGWDFSDEPEHVEAAKESGCCPNCGRKLRTVNEEANTNCLEGIRCPKCGSYEPFWITFTANMQVYDDGTGLDDDVAWDDESDIICCGCQHTGVVAEFRATAGASISAECRSDDLVVEVEFNAAQWFEQANGEQIVALARCGWGDDYPADVVAQYMAEHSGGVRRLFQYLDIIADGPTDTGFECRVNNEEAMAYLAEHRPELHELITRERGD